MLAWRTSMARKEALERTLGPTPRALSRKLRQPRERSIRASDGQALRATLGRVRYRRGRGERIRRLATYGAAALGLLFALMAALLTRETDEREAVALPDRSHRQIPVGLAGVQNQVLRSRRYVYAIRFVLDRPTRVWRFYSGFKLDGLDVTGSDETGYASGTGGRIRARLVHVDRLGRPDLSRVIGGETVGAARRYRRVVADFRLPRGTGLLYFNLRGVRLQAGRLYAMTYQNVARNPADDWFSTNSPTIKASEAGPNGRNTLDPDTRGAVAGLDPREAVAWSTDNGRSWVWGRRVGEGRLRGTYAGDRRGDGGTRLPWYGWQSSAAESPKSNQPYYAYDEQGSFIVAFANAPRAVELTEAGGYAPVGKRVGVVTVRNTRTGQLARTGPLGSGLEVGRLDQPVSIAAGDTYTVANTGTVFKAEGDSFITGIFGVGETTHGFPFRTAGHEADRAELFALPHPYFRPP
jgi:hypothetical protein